MTQLNYHIQPTIASLLGTLMALQVLNGVFIRNSTKRMDEDMSALTTLYPFLLCHVYVYMFLISLTDLFAFS